MSFADRSAVSCAGATSDRSPSGGTAFTPAPDTAAQPGSGNGSGAETATGTGTGTGTGGGRRLGAVGLVVASVTSQQFGSAAATTIFPLAGAMGVVTLRLLFSALLMLAMCRPRVRGHGRTEWSAVLGLGVALGAMNTLFYQAIARIPLGAAVTIELLGPLVLSVVASRRAISLLWAALALGGVALLGGSGFGGLNFAGAGFALAAGGMWTAYILFNSRAGARFPKADGLALALAVAALLTVPLGVADAGGTLAQPRVLGLGAAIAVLSSGVPYTLEMYALRRVPSATFAVLMSLMPVAAVMAGFLLVGQRLAAPELVAVALVVLASMGAVRTSQQPDRTERARSRASP